MCRRTSTITRPTFSRSASGGWTGVCPIRNARKKQSLCSRRRSGRCSLPAAACPTAKAAGLVPNAAYLKEIAQAKQEWEQVKGEVTRPVPGEALSQGHVVAILNDQAQAGDTVITAAGSLPGDLHKLWDVRGGSICH